MLFGHRLEATRRYTVSPGRSLDRLLLPSGTCMTAMVLGLSSIDTRVSMMVVSKKLTCDMSMNVRALVLMEGRATQSH